MQRYTPLWVYVCPSRVQCISIKRHMPRFVIMSWGVCLYSDCHIYRWGPERDISYLDATNFLFMHAAHRYSAHTCPHPHTIDRFIIACQEGAGFTFQQNGPIWWTNYCTPPNNTHPLCLKSSQPHSLCTPRFNPVCQPTQPNPEWLQIHVSVTSFVSAFFIYLFFFTWAGKWGKNGSFWQLHSVWILNVLRP